ncbi:MAG TPA: diguanylate cyclase [Candidatus Avisuccinivibrio pullicola]|nr:diguanylate cyclase [Candidatus Avisuccinivibrio pullicola]
MERMNTDQESSLPPNEAEVKRFGDKAVEVSRLIFYYDAQHDMRMWDLMTPDVTFIGPLPGQEASGLEAYKESIKEDFEFWFDLYEEKYRLDFCDGENALVTGSYLLQSREEEQLYFMLRQRFSMFYVNVDGEPRLKHIHLSNPDNLNQEGETFPFNVGHELRELIDRMKSNATCDRMTGLNNRNFLEENYDSISALLEKSGRGLVMYFDLNGFKQVNDTRGHDTGDFLIISFAQALRHVLNQILNEAIILRAGGDEFIFIDANGSLSEVGYICRSLKSEFHERIRRVCPGVSFSAGFACAKEGRVLSLKELVSIADRRMYCCKRRLKAGR